MILSKMPYELIGNTMIYTYRAGWPHQILVELKMI